MSTRANIGIKRLDGTIEAVYNHWDGYPSYLGNNLLDNYTNIENSDETRQMVEMILSLGDISFLGERLQDSITYNAWRNDGTQKRVYKDLQEYETALGNSWVEYIYIFDLEQGKWLFAPVPYGDDAKLELRELIHSSDMGF